MADEVLYQQPNQLTPEPVRSSGTYRYIAFFFFLVVVNFFIAPLLPHSVRDLISTAMLLFFVVFGLVAAVHFVYNAVKASQNKSVLIRFFGIGVSTVIGIVLFGIAAMASLMGFVSTVGGE